MLRYEYLIFILLMGMMLFVAKIVYSIPFFIARKRRGGEGDDVTGAQLLGTMHANMDQVCAWCPGVGAGVFVVGAGGVLAVCAFDARVHVFMCSCVCVCVRVRTEGGRCSWLLFVPS